MKLRTFFRYHFIEKNKIKKIWIEDSKLLIQLVFDDKVLKIEPSEAENASLESVGKIRWDVYLKFQGVDYFGRGVDVDENTILNFYRTIGENQLLKIRTKRLKLVFIHLSLMVLLIIIPVFFNNHLLIFLKSFRYFLILLIVVDINIGVTEYLRLSKIIQGLSKCSS